MEAARVHGNRFFVQVSGRTNEAHCSIIIKLKSVGQIQVSNVEESDYLLVFCPIASRVGTDISEALEEIVADKPIILVVMHHTFNAQSTMTESRRLVTDRRVRLTVDYLFYQSRLLSCNYNDAAWHEIRTSLGVPSSLATDMDCCNRGWLSNHKRTVCGVGIFIMVILVILVIITAVKTTEKKVNVGR